MMKRNEVLARSGIVRKLSWKSSFPLFYKFIKEHHRHIFNEKVLHKKWLSEIC